MQGSLPPVEHIEGHLGHSQGSWSSRSGRRSPSQPRVPAGDCCYRNGLGTSAAQVEARPNTTKITSED
jgi:hypothetical protein